MGLTLSGSPASLYSCAPLLPSPGAVHCAGGEASMPGLTFLRSSDLDLLCTPITHRHNHTVHRATCQLCHSLTRPPSLSLCVCAFSLSEIANPSIPPSFSWSIIPQTTCSLIKLQLLPHPYHPCLAPYSSAAPQPSVLCAIHLLLLSAPVAESHRNSYSPPRACTAES